MELANVTAAGSLTGRVLRDDAYRPVALEIRGVDPGQVFDAVLASGHQELVLLDVLSLQVAFEQLPALYENGGFTFEEVLQVGHAVADPRERGIDGDKGRGSDDAAEQRVVAAGHRVLDRV